jgi:two-component system, cell cycle sensor histidine kinase and response regulator CckA
VSTPAQRLSDATFRALIENSNDAIVLFDPALNISYASPATERILGYTPAEIVRIPSFDLVHPDDVAQLRTRFEECLAQPGKPIRAVARIRHKNGSWPTMEGVLTNFLDDPHVRGIVNNYREITESVRAETALRESEDKFKRAFWFNPNAMSITTLEEGRFLDVNDAFLRTSGYAREDLIGHVSLETSWVNKEDRSHLLRCLSEQGYVEAMETSFRGKTGAALLVSLSAVVVEIGGVQCVLTTSQDITGRKRAAEKLRRSEEQYRSLVELAPYGIYRASRDGRILMVNSALVKMLGYDSPEEVLRLNLETDVYEDGSERARLLQKVEAGPASPIETTWKVKDGSTISVRLAARLIYDSRSQVLQTEVFVENVTEQRALEKQLQTTQKMEAIAQLAGGVAHDFNNLLMIIRSRAALVIADASQPENVVEEAEEIVRATRRAAELTRQMLAFSRDQVLEPSVLNLNNLLAELGNMLPHLIGKQIETRIVAAPDLGLVKVDRGQFEQVVVNLAINARDAMPTGGRLVVETSNVEIDGHRSDSHPLMKHGRYVLLSVTDTGVGMDKETQAHIFEPFFTTKERGKGTGLGLAMVYGIVQQSGGHISVVSAAGAGTSFNIYLPEATEPEEIERADQLLPAPGGTETILFVEDEETLRKVGVDFLRSKGYDVLAAANGVDALHICRTTDRSIRLLITDVIMPRMGGAELAKNALALNPNLRVLYVSAYSGRALPRGPLKPGQSFLKKPFSMADLARQVRAMLDSKAASEQQDDAQPQLKSN